MEKPDCSVPTNELETPAARVASVSGTARPEMETDRKWSPIRNKPVYVASFTVPREPFCTAYRMMEIHAERLGDAPTDRPRPETETVRPEIEIASGEVASSSHIAIASGHSQSGVDEGATDRYLFDIHFRSTGTGNSLISLIASL